MFFLRLVRAWVVFPAVTMTRTVTGMMAMRMGSSISPHLRPQLHHACGGGHKEQREDTSEKHAHLFYILQLDQPEVQGQQQQHKPVHTGRNRQRQYGMTYFPQKAKREDTRKLKQIIRKKSPLSNS